MNEITQELYEGASTADYVQARLAGGIELQTMDAPGLQLKLDQKGFDMTGFSIS